MLGNNRLPPDSYPAYTPAVYASDPPSKPRLDTRTPEQRVQDQAAAIEQKLNTIFDAPGTPHSLRSLYDLNSLSIEHGAVYSALAADRPGLKRIELYVRLFSDLDKDATAMDAIDALVDAAECFICDLESEKANLRKLAAE